MTHKTYSLLEEDTTVVLGYSLGDFNINKIINEVNQEKTHLSQKNSIYFISRDTVDNLKKQYYESVFGIQVIDEIEIVDFLLRVKEEKEKEKANLILDQISKVTNLINGESFQKEDIKTISILFEKVIERIIDMNRDINDEDSIDALLGMLNQKKNCTQDYGAFSQYKVYANWIITFLNKISWQKLSNNHKEKIEDLVCFSFKKMSKETYIGYSWAAYRIWLEEWKNLPQDITEDIKGYTLMHRRDFDDEINRISDFIPEFDLVEK